MTRPEMKQGRKGRSSPGTAKRAVSFHYVKSPDFRAIHVDGGIGGPTPRGLLHLALYTERQAIPQRIDVELVGERRLGQEVARDGKQGIVRDMQCDLLMDLAAAESIAEWLQKNIAMLKQLIEQNQQGKNNVQG